jgi:hypothetical protein
MQQLNTFLLRIPWYVTALVVAVVVVAGAGATRYFAGPLFYETCENERNLLTGELEVSNCGEGAKVAKREAEGTGGGSAPDGDGAGDTPSATPPGPQPSPAPTAAGAGPGVLASGSFVDGEPGHEGVAMQLQRLADGSLNLFPSNFSVTNGPDLVVVLSEDRLAPGVGVWRLTLDGLRRTTATRTTPYPPAPTRRDSRA